MLYSEGIMKRKRDSFLWYLFFLMVEMIIPTSVAAYNSSYTGKFQGERKFKETEPKKTYMNDRKKSRSGFLSTRHGKMPN